jgi:hypothetical protein
VGAEEEKASHLVEQDLVKLENPEEAVHLLGEAARVSEEEEENKSLNCELFIKSINFQNLRLKYNKSALKNGLRTTEDWIYPQST